MIATRVVLAMLLAVITTPLAFAQGNPTGTVSGRVLSDAGPLPGVTVTATSPNLQGTRSAVTSDNGDYIIPLLPPGDYTLSFELQGFRTLQQTTSVAVGQTVPMNVSMQVAAASETVTVTGQIERFAQTAPVTTTMRATEIASLPSDRSLNSTILFAPGVFNTGPSTNAQDSGATAITISGAMSFENLFMVNGVVINENIRGQGVPLVIEDAVQETTVSTGAISAEFGRFSGGVVNAVTKSGGNRFSGSFRTSLQNDNWRALTPQAGDVKVDDTVPTYEFTGGGPIAKDHLWFFGAGRVVDLVLSRQTTTTNIPYSFTDKERRYEGKLTYSANPNHTVRGAYLYRNRDQLNQNSFNVMDLASLYNRSLPENLTSFNYTGVLSTSFFLESTVSRRRQKFVGSGATSTDIITGTLVTDQARGTRFWAPTFCAVCGPEEERNNDNVVVKGTYFLSTGRTGSHNLVFGYDTFNDIRIAENHQSGSDYRILGTTSIIRNGVVYPSWTNSTIIQWNPINAASQGTDFRTHSLFFNDQWRLTDRLTVNLGVRFDKNAGKDSADQTVADDSAFSPRLAVTWDPAGNGLWTVNAGYGRYVAGLANGIADSGSNGGVPATYQYAYLGPTINTDPNAATLVPTDEALRTLWAWFNANGGTNRPTVGVDIPGVSRRIGDNLRSPSTDEFTVGVTRQLGGRGMVRLDGIYRSWGNFYYSQRDTATGTVTDPAGIARDLTIDGNSNEPERKYAALNAQATWRFGTRLNVNGSYTLSRTFGTFDGETLNNGPITAGPIAAGSATNGRAGWGTYPEYVVADWNRPEGDLLTDQRHRARLWAVYQVPISERWGGLSVSAIEQMNSGSPYFAAGPINPTTYVSVPSYRTPPTQVAYFFTDRDGFRTDNVFRTDLAINYNYRLRGSAELFFQTQIWNLFNGDAIADVNNVDVTTRTRDGGATNLVRFNPFTESPVQGTHWELGPNFGTARNKNAYQQPRQIRFSFGIRF